MMRLDEGHVFFAVVVLVALVVWVALAVVIIAISLGGVPA